MTFGNISRPVITGLGLFGLLLAFFAALAISGNHIAHAHEETAEHDGILLTPEAPEWVDNAERLKFNVKITDEHSDTISRPEGELAWSYKWFSYEYIPDGEFSCDHPPFEIRSRLRLGEWLENNGYSDDIYETQKDIFDSSGSHFSVFLQSDGSYKSSFVFLKNKDGLARYINGEGTLAFCFEIKYDDGSHASLSSVIVDFSNLDDSQIETGVAQGEESPTTNRAVNIDTQDTGAGGGTDNQIAGGVGDGPSQEDLPETGLVKGLDDSLLLTISLSFLAIVSLALLKVFYNAKRHNRQKQ